MTKCHKDGWLDHPCEDAMNILNLAQIVVVISMMFANQACSTLGFSARIKTVDTVQIPMIKNSANECYYLDEFMPLPDGMVTGKAGNLSLRYYNYRAANYKDWEAKQVVLSF